MNAFLFAVVAILCCVMLCYIIIAFEPASLYLHFEAYTDVLSNEAGKPCKAATRLP